MIQRLYLRPWPREVDFSAQARPGEVNVANLLNIQCLEGNTRIIIYRMT